LIGYVTAIVWRRTQRLGVGYPCAPALVKYLLIEIGTEFFFYNFDYFKTEVNVIQNSAQMLNLLAFLHIQNAPPCSRGAQPLNLQSSKFPVLSVMNIASHYIAFVVVVVVVVVAVPWLKRLVASLSTRRPGFNSESVRVGFVVDKVALGQVFPRVLRLSPVRFIPPVLH
jgi:hypothetical protein